MNHRSKTLLAILAVALMVGTALVPLAGVSGEDATDDVTTSDTGSMDFNDIVNALKDFGKTGRTLLINGCSFVPVANDAVANEDITVTGKVEGPKIVTNGQVAMFKDTVTFIKNTANENGRLIIQAGGTLALLPFDGTDHSFTLVNGNKDKSFDGNVVVMECGAKLNVCGITFKMFCEKVGGASYQMPIVKLSRDIKASFTSEYKNGNYSFGLKVDDSKSAGRVLQLFGVLDFFRNSDVTVSCDYVYISGEHKYTNMSIDGYINDYKDNYRFKGNGGSATVKLTESAVTDATTVYNIELSVDWKLSEFKYWFTDVGEEYPTLTLTNAEFKFNGCKVTITNTISKQGTKDVVTTNTVIGWTSGSDKKITLGATKAVVGYKPSLISLELTIDEPSFTLSGLSVDATTKTTGKLPVTREITSMDSNASLSFKATSMELDIPLIISQIELTKMKDFAVAISSLGTTYDVSSESLKTTVGSFGITGVVTSDEIVSSSITLIGSVTDFSHTVDVAGDSEKLAFSALAELSVRYDGADRFSKLTIDKFVLTSTGDVNTAKIDSVTLTNDIPFSKILPVTDNPIGSLEAKTLTLSRNGSGNLVIGGSSLSFENSTITTGIADKYGVSANDFSIEIVTESEKPAVYILSSAAINGFAKNIGADKEPFSVTGSPAKVSVTFVEKANDFRITIEQGTATFGKGLLPFHLIVNDGVVFSANGLSAPGFTFGENVTMSGTIVVDFADNLKFNRGIKIGSDLLRMRPLEDGNDLGGYALSLDLATRSGTIVAHDGWTLNDSPKGYWTKSDSTHATFDFKSMTLKNVTTSAFYFSVEGGEREQVHYGDAIELSNYDVPVKTGKVFVGWNDGSKTYNSDATYIMPARTVVMTPVFADVVTPTPVEGEPKTVVVESKDPESTSVAVSAESIKDMEKVIIEVSGATVVMEKETIETVTDGAEGNVILSVQKVDNIIEELKKDVVGENDLYNINLTVDGESVTYNEKTSFKVTLNVPAEGYITGFNVSYMDDTYHTTTVGVEGYVDCGDGTYDVTFNVNHFSDYVVEPIYGQEPEPEQKTDYTFVIAVVAMLVLAITVIGCVMYSSKDWMKH